MKQTYALIVDDDDSVSDILIASLNHFGYQTKQAKTGQEAINLLQQEQAHVILLDLNLPDMHGFDVCRAIRQQGYNTPIIIMSVENQEQQVVRGLKIGANDYISKPFSVNELISRIEAHLHWQQVYSQQRPLPPSSAVETTPPDRQPKPRTATEEVLMPLEIRRSNNDTALNDTKPLLKRKKESSEEMPLLTRLAIRNGNRRRKNTATLRLEARDKAKVDDWNREFAAQLDKREAELKETGADSSDT